MRSPFPQHPPFGGQLHFLGLFRSSLSGLSTVPSFPFTPISSHPSVNSCQAETTCTPYSLPLGPQHLPSDKCPGHRSAEWRLNVASNMKNSCRENNVSLVEAGRVSSVT